MLIVCPNCASSYMIDQAAVGPAGRTVRCARCKETWLAGAPESAPAVTAAADSVVAAAEPPSAPSTRAEVASPPAAPTPPQPASGADKVAEDSELAAAIEPEAPPAVPPPPQPAPADAPATVHAEAQAPESEPATIADAPPLVPPIEHEPLPDAAAAEPDAESVDARRKRLRSCRKKSARSSRWTAIILVLVSFNVALIGARKDVVRYLPQTASLFAAIGLPVNLRGLKFENVGISMEEQNGIATLIVQGAIVSEVDKPVAVPRLRFAARNPTGQEVYTWTMPPPRSVLGPGQRFEFRSQIPAPPAGAKDVIVRFFTAQDAAAGAK